MDKGISAVRVRNGQLSPTQGEVWITVVPQQQTPATEVRGRIVGPSCAYARTIEIAYPLRHPPPDSAHAGEPGITMRAVLPEPSLWDTESPFLYQCQIELWQDGQRCDEVSLRHGLRSFHMGKRGLSVNERLLSLRGLSVWPHGVKAFSEGQARQLHQEGFNLLVTNVDGSAEKVLERGDQLGFLVLGDVAEDSEKTRRLLTSLRQHASCLGWLIDARSSSVLEHLPDDCIIGWQGDDVPSDVNRARIDFVFGHSIPALLGKPLLATGSEPSPSSTQDLLLGEVSM